MHALRPVSRVREMDTRCMIWLARRPGRTAREKTVMNRRILGVQRERSSNTLENQVARRVLHELRPLISQRLAFTDVSENPVQNDPRLSQLRSAFTLCGERLRRSPWNEIDSSAIPKSNNVLLKDPCYKRVWKVWEWLRQYNEENQQAWKTGPQRLTLAVFWVLTARLYDRVPTVLYDSFYQIGTGFAGDFFGARRVTGESNGQPGGESPSVRVLCDLTERGNRAFEINMRVKDGRILARVWVLSRSSFSINQPSHLYEIDLSFHWDESRRETHAAPLAATLYKKFETVMEPGVSHRS